LSSFNFTFFFRFLQSLGEKRAVSVTSEGPASYRPSDAKKRRLVAEPMEDLPEATVVEIIATIDAPPNMVGPEVCEIISLVL
jgi:hypothetical protein